MPKVTRSSATAGRITRQSRAVFGDVSNNGKKNGTKAMAAKTSAAAPSTARVTDAQPIRRRSTRLSRGEDGAEGSEGNNNNDTHNLEAVAGDAVVTLTMDTNISIMDRKPSAVTNPRTRSARSNATNTSITTNSTSSSLEDGNPMYVKPTARVTRRRDATGNFKEGKEPSGNNAITMLQEQLKQQQQLQQQPKRSKKRGEISLSSSGNDEGTAQATITNDSKRARSSYEQSLTMPKQSSSPEQTEQQITTKKSKKDGPGPDFLAQDDFRLFRENTQCPFDASKFTLAIAPADLVNHRKIEEAPEYITDIMQRLFDREEATCPKPYLQDQPKLNKNMRSILIDWLIEVHMKFRLVPETLYLCVNIIDRYLEKAFVERAKLQLVGITALLVACKYEEIYPPEVRDCCYICDHAYTRQEVLDMEANILKVLEYRLSAPTAHPFLLRFLYLTNATETQRHATFYYMDRMLQQYKTLDHRASLIAAACVSLALNNPQIRAEDGIKGKLPGVPQTLLDYSGFELEQVMKVAALVASKVKENQVTNSKRNLLAVRKKYELDKYSRVSEEFKAPDIGHLENAYTFIS